MSEERKRTEHPSWCDPEACTAPEFRPTSEEYRAGDGERGQHRSKALVTDQYRRDGGSPLVYLYQLIAPWQCTTYLGIQIGEGEYGHPDVISTEVGPGGAGFDLYELLGQEVKDAVRQYPTLFAERFPDVERAIEDEADEATADAVMPRDPVELEERMAAELLADDDTTGSADEASKAQDVVEGAKVVLSMSYVLTVNGDTTRHGTFRDLRAAVADVVTRRLAAAPERVAEEAQAMHALFQPRGAVQEELDARGEWFTVFDQFSEEQLRIRISAERD